MNINSSLWWFFFMWLRYIHSFKKNQNKKLTERMQTKWDSGMTRPFRATSFTLNKTSWYMLTGTYTKIYLFFFFFCCPTTHIFTVQWRFESKEMKNRDGHWCGSKTNRFILNVFICLRNWIFFWENVYPLDMSIGITVK